MQTAMPYARINLHFLFTCLSARSPPDLVRCVAQIICIRCGKGGQWRLVLWCYLLECAGIHGFLGVKEKKEYLFEPN